VNISQPKLRSEKFDDDDDDDDNNNNNHIKTKPNQQCYRQLEAGRRKYRKNNKNEGQHSGVTKKDGTVRGCMDNFHVT